ncbi:4-diphosphocytidyl-2-C-methylerythritol kinase [Wigglesworthia glossinidia endosymbiont of Glossina morsitans morsitans (Yale colony)]|uniref:4-diphosphocytidyl-2-C-methyl-D-erythritol kinase n=1 Tax=Wigglesworthia glossinidia endosymbiont of Glossina morsitans morsitans (Yale colony) TaxID=1142511 RepID=H6Q4W8_WIGGL|nr:4-(cytidine 5'-diphospho)-2-C-methyl-D-erythritol kinase [Wigglesworthia glossinidia]AFA41251.1 4-diphosphocytidyl-2-C-methylerythritol kinase [Wigglesworthia glossinidia endosymbiont of Glossina morsitans morsitans (Yale colony)]
MDILKKYNWPSPAKINLFLSVVGRRSDGYHYIQTLFRFLEYSDILIINSTLNKKITLINTIQGIHRQNNLILKAAKLLQNFMKRKKNQKIFGADIYVKKKIPLGSGLGGGSSNAATTLIALNFHWRCQLSLKTLANLGLQIGADVPVFIYGKSAFAEGIGEKLSSVNLPLKWYIIIIPPIKISTQSVFNKFSEKNFTVVKTFNQYLQKPFVNDFEAIVKKNFCTINKLIENCSKYAKFRLTGTGGCIFAEFSSEKKARIILQKLPKYIRAFISKGSNISILHRIIKIRSHSYDYFLK